MNGATSLVQPTDRSYPAEAMLMRRARADLEVRAIERGRVEPPAQLLLLVL